MLGFGAAQTAAPSATRTNEKRRARTTAFSQTRRRPTRLSSDLRLQWRRTASAREDAHAPSLPEYLRLGSPRRRRASAGPSSSALGPRARAVSDRPRSSYARQAWMRCTVPGLRRAARRRRLRGVRAGRAVLPIARHPRCSRRRRPLVMRSRSRPCLLALLSFSWAQRWLLDVRLLWRCWSVPQHCAVRRGQRRVQRA